MTAIVALARGILLGLGAAVPIGPVNVEIARRTLKSGFSAGAAIGCGACTVDMAYALAVSLGIGESLARNRTLSMVLGVAGALLLGWLALGCFRGAAAGLRGGTDSEGESAGTMPGPAPTKLLRTYGQGLLMTATNPMTLAFWFVALPGIVGQAANPRELTWTCAGVGIGALGWALGFAATLSFLGRWKRGVWVVATDLAGGTILLGFAAVAVWRVIRTG